MSVIYTLQYIGGKLKWLSKGKQTDNRSSALSNKNSVSDLQSKKVSIRALNVRWRVSI